MFRCIVLGLVALSGCTGTENNLYIDSSLTAQPNPPDLTPVQKEDRIVQVTVPAVDVLWVIDNSCSMIEEQIALTDNFDNFVGYFVNSGLDYHIGVVSTDWDNETESGDHRGRLQTSGGRKWIDDTVSNPSELFKEMAVLGTDGSAYEKGRAQIVGALDLNGDTLNAGFYRDDAFLMVVVISDEDDSSGVVGAYDNSTPPDIPHIVDENEFISWMRNLKSNEEKVSFSSIVGPDEGCLTAIEAGTEYLSITRAIGGIEWSICNPNWDEVLDELGMQAAGLKREFYLSEVPVEDSLQVRIVETGEELTFERDIDWEYNRSRNSILFFTYVPDALSEIFISYDVLAGEQESEEASE